jgi:hypothetical protein
VIPAGKHGVLLLAGDAKSRSRDQDWEVKMFDTQFKELWSQNVTIYGTLSLTGWVYSNSHLYVHLGSNNSGKYTLMDVDFDNRIIKQRDGYLRMKGAWHRISASGSKVFCPWSTKKAVYLNIVDMSNGSTNLVSVATKGWLLDADLSEGSDEMCLVYNRKGGGQVSTHLAWVDTTGKPKNDLIVEYKGEERINTGSATKISDNTTIITGTYNNNNSSFNSGMFFGLVGDGKVQALQYHPFTKFENFFEYLSERSQQRIERKIKRKEARGGELKLNYRLITHPVRKLGDNFLTLSEAYYPEYHTEYRTVWVSGRPTTQSYTVFDGYRYTHAVLACFDAGGNLLWDHCFPIWNVLTFDLKRYVRMGILKDDEVELVLARGTSITSMVIKDGEMKKDRTVDYLETLDEADRVRWSANSGIEFWYDRYFLAYGFSRIVNKEEEGPGRKRTVFYFNKVEL